MAFPGCHDNPVSSLNWHVHSGVAPNLGLDLQADKKTQRSGKSCLFYRLGWVANVEKDAQAQQSIHPGNGFHGDPSPKSYHQTQGFTHQEQTEEGISAVQV